MVTAQLGTAVWIRTDAPLARLESALRPLPVRLEPATGGFVHVLYDLARWPVLPQASPLPTRRVLDCLVEAQVDFVPAIGPVVVPCVH